MNVYKYNTWMDMLRFTKSRGNNWTYIILGRTGPTGKTYLCNLLRENGHNAVEISEDVYPLLDYHGIDNHYFVYKDNKCAVIILNKPLKKEN